MVRKDLIDKYFYDQPPQLFEKDLKEKVVIKIHDMPKKAKDGYVLFKGINLDAGEFKNLDDLSVIFADFEDFISFNEIKGDDYAISLVKDEKFVKENFRIEIGEKQTKIFAGDINSVIRGILYLEHELTINHGELKIGETEVSPTFTGRITRCFFSPTNRPPKNGDELFDDVDYYPENYLNKLMHDGISGIWIYTDFCSLASTSVIPEYGVGREKRLAKLDSICKRAKKYGIGIYIFCMEPMSLTNESITKKHGDIVKKYPHLCGNKNGPDYAFCAHTEYAERYIRESLEQIFGACPDLKGYVSITQGERYTACQNMTSDVEGKPNICPRCGHIPIYENLAYIINLIKTTLSKIKPDAEFISWTYGHRSWSLENIGKYVEYTNSDVVLMQNFEDGGIETQLGKKQISLDYWLSVPGPSEMFEHTAKSAMKFPHEMWAKLQVCCSHEIASIPYVPVPGIIYDKLTRAKELNVKGFMESWYFGNYPCLMSRGVGLMSFKNYDEKNDFLLDLAKLYWNEEEAPKVVEAWNCFENGYINYPINSLMGYYGPAHDSVVWDLALKPRNFSLPRSWQLLDPPDGDRIGESIFASHTVDEIITLYTAICSWWNRGVEILSSLPSVKKGYNEQYSVAKSIGVLFNSAKNIYEFYKLRNDLGYQLGDDKAILARMKEIVYDEIANSTKMIELCKNDNRLGYHSEAEGYKFFPKKMEERICKLKTLLETEFVETEKRIDDGLAPLEYYTGKDPDGLKRYKAGKTLEDAPWEFLNDGDAKFKLAIDEENIYMELYNSKKHHFYVGNEFVLGLPKCVVTFCADGTHRFQWEAISHQTMFGKKAEKELAKWKVEKVGDNYDVTHVKVTISKKDAGFFRLPYKLLVKTANGHYDCHATWVYEENPIHVLGKKMVSPNEFGWVE